MPPEANLYIDPQHRLLDPSRRELEPQAGDRGYVSGRVRSIDPDNRTVTGVVSTANVDRYEERVLMSAYERRLDQFMENPVFVAGHVYSAPDGKPTVIGHWTDVHVEGNELIGTARFANTELAEEYWQLYRDGHQRAFSVGFLVHDWEFRDIELDGTKQKIRHFTDIELLEISAVSIPANRESLARVASLMKEQEGGSHDAETQRLMEQIDQRIHHTIRKALDPDTNGPLGNLLEALAEMCQAGVVQGPSDDRSERGKTDPASTDVADLLRRAADQLGGN